MLAISFNTGPLFAGFVLGALGLGLLGNKRFRRWGFVGLATSAVLMAASVVFAPSEHLGETLVSPQSQPVAVVREDGGYRVTVDVGDCLTLYHIDGADWRPAMFDMTPGNEWDGKAEEFCTMALHPDTVVRLPDQIKEGSWGLCSGTDCYTLERS